jgi:hypothetical protein
VQTCNTSHFASTQSSTSDRWPGDPPPSRDVVRG